MLKLTPQNFDEMIQEIGSNAKQKITTAIEFMDYIRELNPDGEQYTIFEKYLRENFDSDIRIYNKKEGRSALDNAFRNLRSLLMDEYSGEPQKKESPVSRKETPVPQEEEQADLAAFMQAAKEYFRNSDVSIKEDENIDCTQDNKRIPGKNIIIEDGIGLTDFDSSLYSTRVIAITDRTFKKVIAAGELIKDGSYYLINTTADSIEPGSWGESNLFRVILFPASVNSLLRSGDLSNIFSDPSGMRYADIKIKTAEPVISDSPLCIDFGTSNTTAGYFVESQEDEKHFMRVKFQNTLEKEFTMSEIIPTILYVKRCVPGDPKNNVYLFGYDAQKEFIKKDYTTDADIFFDLKRWLGSAPYKEIEISDENSVSLTVTYSDLIRAYLLFIIRKSEDYARMKFKKIHFTSPVKMKRTFLRQFRQMLDGSGYEVISENALDEGISVVYETIRNNIRSTAHDFTSTDMMVIDCGGGTTDVASCRITKNNSDGIETLGITTQYLGGDINYGGNNITYRIMQFVKIKMAFYYQKGLPVTLSSGYSVFLNEILPSPDEILSIIDKDNSAVNVYKKLNEEYDEAEKVLPTRFEEKTEYTKTARKKRSIRRNFFYLWELAERIKKEFYKKDHQLTLIGFNDLTDSSITDNYENIISDSELNFSLFVCNGSDLEQRTDIPDISITAQEVDDLIRGDIYSLLNRIFYNGENVNYESYRFTGQSCKIRLFSELTKEFIPGKRMRTLITSHNNDYNSEQLKATCVKGTVFYEYDTRYGNIKPVINNDSPDFSFTVSTNFNGKESKVLSPDDISLFPITDKTEFISVTIRNRFDEITNNNSPVKLMTDFSKMSSIEISDCLYQNTDKRYAEKLVEQITNSPDGRYCFIFPGKNGFDLNAVAIKIRSTAGQTEYELTNSTSILVENLAYTYFDGKK